MVPGGFGDRGVEGKILACKYARENKVPFLGICLGMQCAAIEFARNVCGIDGANSSEFRQELSELQQVVIDMPEHAAAKHGMGATMRLGSRKTKFLTPLSKLRKLYNREHHTNSNDVDERHRHRYEVNPAVVPTLSDAGLHFVGMGVDETSAGKEHIPATSSSAHLIQMASTDDSASEAELLRKIKSLCHRGGDGVTAAAVRMEMVELKDHPFYAGVQYHPEYTSDALKPSPPFLGLILASIGELDNYIASTFTSEIEELTNMVCIDENILPTLVRQLGHLRGGT